MHSWQFFQWARRRTSTCLCRFGTDPKTSVLDPQNRAHEVDNLYVADSSFFPSSTGLNRSLTIAANALRVAAHVNQAHFAT